MRQELITAIDKHQSAFGLELTTETIRRLADHFDLVQAGNEFLHLVGPCSPEDFAIRHILESLTLLEYLPAGSKFADIGAGAGLPSVPCLLARDDLTAVLIESKEKKTAFLETVVAKLGLERRVSVVNRQFQEVDATGCQAVTCRALDKFSEKLPRLIKWAQKRTLLLFGGNNLRDPLIAAGVKFDERLMPLSEQRYLYISHK